MKTTYTHTTGKRAAHAMHYYEKVVLPTLNPLFKLQHDIVHTATPEYAEYLKYVRQHQDEFADPYVSPYKNPRPYFIVEDNMKDMNGWKLGHDGRNIRPELISDL